MSKEILFSNGAIQNREFSLDEKPYKALGIAAARVLNEFAGNDANDDVHCWNNVGTFDTQMETSSDERLDAKYQSAFMQEHLARWGVEQPNLLCDDDAGFSEWSLDVLNASLEKKAIYIEKTEFTYCKDCDVAIAEQCVDVKNCSQCGSNAGLSIRNEDALFVNRNVDHTKILSFDQIFNKINLKHEINSLKQIPERLLLSRDRSRGVDLGEIGLEGKRMDPRLGIGMLAVYAAAKQGYTKAGLTQSISTLIRTVPYLNSVITDPDSIGVPEYNYAFYAKVDPKLLTQQWATPELLMLHSLGQRNDITETNATKIEREKSLIEAKIQYIETTIDPFHEESSQEAIADKPFDGNFTFMLSHLNKQLGRCMEYIKHNRTPSAEERAIITATLKQYETMKKFF